MTGSPDDILAGKTPEPAGKVRVRFAPSPTGYLHVGGARTALFNWLYARRHGGVFILRIEDTDAERNSVAAVDQILEGLRWLGLNWDEGPFFQSQRHDIHRAWLKKLEESGGAYRSYATVQEVEAFRKAEGLQHTFKRSRHEPPADEIKRRQDAGAPYVLRLDIGDTGAVKFRDHVRGDMSFERAALADLVLSRADGSPLYNFVCVVDDVDMAITHVIRGEDHLTNTARQIATYEAMGAPIPEFAHLPLILGADKQRLSKRHGATSVQQYQDEGYLPDAMINFLGLLGWSPGDERELFTRDELAKLFTLDRINKAGAVFDNQKLDWINGLYIRERVPREELYRMVEDRLRAWAKERFVAKSVPAEAAAAGGGEPALEAPVVAQEVGVLEKLADSAWLRGIIDLEIERAKVLADFPKNLAYFFEAPSEYEEQGVKKFIQKEGSRELMADGLAVLETAEPFDAATLERELRARADARGANFTKMAQPIRIAITGRTASPPLFDVLIKLGREECVRRMKAATEKLLGGPQGA
jgi:glutamyl-tRNA synthetase